MAKLLACRVCLSTELKLYPIHNELKIAYESLTGLHSSHYVHVVEELDSLDIHMAMKPMFMNFGVFINNCSYKVPVEIKQTERYPRHLCSYCSALLMKSISFRDRCLRSMELLKYAMVENRVLTNEYISTIDKDAHQLSSPYSILIHPFMSTLTDPIIKLENQYTESDVVYDGGDVTGAKLTNEIQVPEYYIVNKEEVIFDSSLVDNGGDVDSYADVDIPVEEGKTDVEYTSLEHISFDVVTLSKEEQLQEVVDRQHSRNYQQSFYKCVDCFKGFLTEATHQNHMDRHDPSWGPYACEICKIRCNSKYTLRSHSRSTHELKYTCRLCSYTCKMHHKAREHYEWHSGKVYVCKVCGAKFRKSTSHLTHMRLRHPCHYRCECGEQFISQHGLNVHRKKTHTRFDTFNLVIQIMCESCNKKFQNQEALEKHMSYAQDGVCDTKLKSCNLCGESFHCLDKFRRHQKENHAETEVKCEKCKRTFAHERSFAAHYYKCQTGLNRDLKVPSEKQPLICEICGKNCISKATLMHHQRIHTGEKPYQCMLCPKQFSVPQRLEIHIRTHTGECPFKCHVCPKAFKHKAALNRHARVHTGVKPYSCSYCGKSFSQSNSMKLHVKTVHLKMPDPYKRPRHKVVIE